MFRSTNSLAHLLRIVGITAIAGLLLGGCAVVTVASTAVGVAATGVGLAVDAGVGAVKLTGRAVGAAADAVLPGGN
jgi:hypothetical protein